MSESSGAQAVAGCGRRGHGPGAGNREDENWLLGKLRLRSRRGQRELDILLARWLDTRYPSATAGERRAFERLLECSNPDILDWVLGRAAPPAELSHVVRALAAGD